MLISGFDNEKNLVSAMDGFKFKELNNNLKLFIKELFPDIMDNDVIRVSPLGGIYKRDLEIIFNNESVRN